MPALNFILPAAGADSPVSPTPASISAVDQPMEKFQTVMERITGHGCPNVSQPKIRTGQASLPGTPSPECGESRNVGSIPAKRDRPDSRHFESPATMPTKSDLAPATDAPVPSANIVPIIAELSATASPVCMAAKTDEASPKPQPSAEAKIKSADVIAIGFAGENPVAGLMPATTRLAQLLSAANSDTTPTAQPAQIARQTDAPTAPMSGQMDLSPHAGGKSILLSPEKSGETKAAVPDMKGEAENQQPPAQSATIIIKVGARPELGLMPDSAKLTDGTGVAQQDMNVKMATKMTNFSEATGQKLPVAPAPVPATGENLPRIAAGSSRTFTPVTVVGAEISASAAAVKAAPPETLDLSQTAPAGTPLLERTQGMVTLQAVRLRESGTDELRVVIKPDVGTQLSLNLRQRDGVVEVQAVLDRGNFDQLSRHWPELQQQLEARGVRVAPLSSAENTFGGGSEGFRQPTTPHGQPAGDDADAGSAPARPVALVPGLATATATASASTSLARNWETWA
jgi:hypothetical protein